MPVFTRLSKDSPPSVLVVDPDPDICSGITDLLTAKGWKVHRVPDGKTCLEQIQHQGFDAILLREYLPDMDGLSLLNVLRIRRRGTPVIFLTGSGPSPMALQRGACAVVTLPYEREELSSLLQSVIR